MPEASGLLCGMSMVGFTPPLTQNQKEDDLVFKKTEYKVEVVDSSPTAPVRWVSHSGSISTLGSAKGYAKALESSGRTARVSEIKEVETTVFSVGDKALIKEADAQEKASVAEVAGAADAGGQ